MKNRILTTILFLVSFSVISLAQAGLKITEICFDPPAGAAGTFNSGDANGDGTRSSRWDEFVEIYNGGTEAVDLSGYQLVEREGIPFFTFPLNATLNAGQFTVVFGGGPISTFTNIPAGTLLFSVQLTDPNSGFAAGTKSNLSNTSDRVMLVNPLLADTLDEIYWGGPDVSPGAQPISPLTKHAIFMGPPNTISGTTIFGAIGQTITRDINGTKWDVHTYVVSDPAKLFSPGANAKEKKIQANVALTEVMFDVPADLAGDANGDGVRGAKSDEFVEIYNKGPIDAKLKGFKILDREGVTLYTFPDSTLKIGQFAVVFGSVGSAGFSGITPEALVFSVNKSDADIGFDNGLGKTNFSNAGDGVLLVNSIEADTLAEVYWGTASPRSTKAIYLDTPHTVSGLKITGAIKQSVTHKIDSDLWDLHTVVSGDATSLFSPGLDAPKSPYVNTGDLMLTEILFDPPTDPILGDVNGDGTRDNYGDEFVELYNRGASTIDLSGYKLLETSGLSIFTFPAGAKINAGQYAVVFGNIRPTGLGTSLPKDAVYFSVSNTDANSGFSNGAGKTNLSQTADAVILVNPAAADTLVEIYWGTASPKTSKAIYMGFPNTKSGLTVSGNMDQSITRTVSSSKWDLHTVITKDINSLYSPGKGAPVISGIEKEESLPQSYKLSQNYPNPFNPETTISFSIPKSEAVSLKIFDVLGREVVVLVNSDLTPGTYNYRWDASSLASGIYFYKLTTGSFSSVKKMMLIK